MKRIVSARRANREFSKLLAAAADGAEIVITRRGTPVAKLVPVARRLSGAKREKAIKELIEMMRTGIPMGGVKVSRDEIYEERLNRYKP